jgi:hypothetical protein
VLESPEGARRGGGPVRGRQASAVSERTELEAKSGQRKLPVIEFEDGTTLREESKDMAARIREGKLASSSAAQPPTPPAAG